MSVSVSGAKPRDGRAWERVQVAGRPADVFDPPGRRGAAVYLHPHGGLLGPDWPALTAALAEHRLGCVAPHAGTGWWLGPDERHLTEAVVPFARTAFGATRLAGFGVRAGGQGAVRLGFRRPDLLPVVGSLAGAFDFHEEYGRGSVLDDLYESAERARLDTAILHLNPTSYPPHVWLACAPADPWWRGNDRLHEKLAAYGVPHVADLDATAGDDPAAYLDARVGPLVAWTADALASEGRRLL